MSGEFVKAKWQWTVAGLLVFGGLLGIFVLPAGSEKANAQTAVQMEIHSNLNAPRPGAVSRWAKTTDEQRVLAAVEKYTNEIAYNRDSEETPENLFRLANLYYSKLRDYENASLYYLTLLQDFPDYKGMRLVYSNLVNCYRFLGKEELRRETLRQMMEHYGPGTEEYLFAEREMSPH